MTAPQIPLTRCADEAIATLAKLSGAPAIAQLDGATLLGERATLMGLRIPGCVSAGGGCTLYSAVGDSVALNLARPVDRELLPALFQTEAISHWDARTLSRHMARSDAAALVARGRSLGLALAAEHESPTAPTPCIELVRGSPSNLSNRRVPRVLDLSALWAGPLCAHLLWLTGADVVKVESRSRPDALRTSSSAFYELLNQGKASVVLDFADTADRRALLALLEQADIVIEAARPRALQQLGIDAADIVRRTPGLVWVTITAHGAEHESGHWVGFGDDCSVAGGLSAALRAASGVGGFVGDAIADPLTGIFAALHAWQAWAAGRGGRFGIAMSHVVAACLAAANHQDAQSLQASLKAWAASTGQPFPAVTRRAAAALPNFGEHTRVRLAQAAPC